METVMYDKEITAVLVIDPYNDFYGQLIIVGAVAEPLQIPGVPLVLGRRSVVGWPSGSSIDSEDTVAFSSLTGVRPMTEVFPLKRAAEASEHMMSGKARFRAVLTTAL
jgi:D-arabinose 1-dehydrogenase-like Zn-dependent alcohol dehydrogenase